jgi:cytochrome c peroxidase
MNKRALAAFVLVLAHAASSAFAHDGAHGQAIPREIEDLSIDNLGEPPKDPGNRWADDPRAAELGKRLFFDARLSSNGKVSCASCHDPGKQFQDGTPLAHGVGTTDRRTMPIAGTAYSPFLFWDGRKDSQWSQALGPLESAVEHGGTREQYADVVAANYREDYERVFGPLPQAKDRESVTRVFVNIGKAIAAYERGVRPLPSRFDAYVAAWKKDGKRPAGMLTPDEAAGLDLFAGKANCTQCHNGPLLTNNEFHNTGVPKRAGLPEDRGRIVAVKSVQSDEFNCRSRWSDAKPGECSELEYLAPASSPLERAYKVPSLRNVAERAPYMHAGQLSTLGDVIRHYNQAPAAPAGHTELRPLRLTNAEMRQIEAFLGTLSGGTSGN